MKRILAVALIGLIAAACASEEDSGSQNEAEITNVKVLPDRFEPTQVRIKAGKIVRWTWMGGEHNVVTGPDCGQVDGLYRSGAPMSGGTAEKRFDVAGTYPYYCERHCSMGMKGEVIVEE